MVCRSPLTYTDSPLSAGVYVNEVSVKTVCPDEVNFSYPAFPPTAQGIFMVVVAPAPLAVTPAPVKLRVVTAVDRVVPSS